MFLNNLLLIFIGLSSGLIVSGGVFTVLISVGLIPRFAGKMHVARRIFVLEEMVILGTLTGNFASIFTRYAMLGSLIRSHRLLGNATEGVWNLCALLLLAVIGLFSGIFVGCLALAIAEMLDSIPIFARRVGFRHGLGIAILAVALGKCIGSLIYFTQEIYLCVK